MRGRASQFPNRCPCFVVFDASALSKGNNGITARTTSRRVFFSKQSEAFPKGELTPALMDFDRRETSEDSRLIEIERVPSVIEILTFWSAKGPLD